MPRKRGAGAVPKQTIEAFFPRTPEQVWRAVTDPIYWDWPNGPGTVHEPRDGPIIVTEDWGLTEEMLTVFRVAAFAPPRWYAVELDNRETVGRCEVYFFRERRGAPGWSSPPTCTERRPGRSCCSASGWGGGSSSMWNI